jgi:hypothetical protein
MGLFKTKTQSEEDKAKKIAEDIVNLSDDRTLAISSVIDELIKIENGEVSSRVYTAAKRVIDTLRYYGESGYITISRFTFSPANIFAGDILLQTFPDKLETNDTVQVIWFKGVKEGMVSYLFSYISSDGKMADLKDAQGNKLEMPMFWIMSKVIKVIPLTSEEGQEIFKKIRHTDFINNDIIQDIKESKEKELTIELNKRLEIIKKL